MIKKNYLIICFFINLNCAGSPILSDLVNDRIKFIIMASYETNHLRPIQNVYLDNNLDEDNINIKSFADVSQDDIGIYLDIGEARLSKGNANQDFRRLNEDELLEDFWHFFVRERKVFCTDYYSTDIEEKDTCEKQKGIAGFKNLYSESGVVYPASDVESGQYTHLGIYFRRIVFDYIETFNIEGNSVDRSNCSRTIPHTTPFDTFDISGIDFLPRVQYAPDDEINQFSLNYTFPRAIPILYKTLYSRLKDLYIEDSNEAYVLEYRLFLRNLIMQHRLDFLTNNVIECSQSYLGLSDWHVDHPVNTDRHGGNLITRAKVYIPSKTGTVQVTDMVGSLQIDTLTNPRGTLPGQWLILENQVSLQEFREKHEVMPYAAAYTDGNSTITFKNIMPGKYKLFRSCDQVSSAPKYSFNKKAEISVENIDNLEQVGGYLDLGVFNQQIRGITFSGTTIRNARNNLFNTLRALPFNALITKVGNASIRIEPVKKEFYVQGDFAKISGPPEELLVLNNAVNVSLTKKFKAGLLQGGPDGFPEEVRACLDAQGTEIIVEVESGKHVILQDLTGSDCECTGLEY